MSSGPGFLSNAKRVSHQRSVPNSFTVLSSCTLPVTRSSLALDSGSTFLCVLTRDSRGLVSADLDA